MNSTAMCTLRDILRHDLSQFLVHNLIAYDDNFPSWQLRQLPMFAAITSVRLTIIDKLALPSC